MSFRSQSLLSCLCLALVTRAAFADTAEFALHNLMDDGAKPHVAVDYLLPEGWQAKDAVSENAANYLAPLSVSTVASSPDNKYIVRWISRVATSWSKANSQATGQPPPEHPSDLLVTVFQKGHPGIDVTVIDRQETPISRLFKPSNGIQFHAFTCSVKLKYVLNGTPTITKSGFTFDSYALASNQAGFWTLRNITSITGPEADFPHAMKLAAILLSSRQWDPQFFEQYCEIQQMIDTEAKRERTAEIPSEFAALRREFHDLRDANQQAFTAEADALEKNTRDFCDGMKDSSRYTDDHTAFLLPKGYSHAATDGTNYVFTDDPSYKAEGTWHELTKTH